MAISSLHRTCAAAVLAAATPVTVQAEPIDTRTHTCSAFIQARQSDDPNEHANAEFLLSWLAGYFTPVTPERAVDLVSIAQDGERLLEACRTTPDQPILDAASSVFAANATPAGKTPTVLSETTCAALQGLSPEEAMTLANNLMWLLGQEARRTGTTLTDPDAIGGHMKRVGEVCRADASLAIPAALDRTLAAPSNVNGRTSD